MKRILSVILAAALVLSLVPAVFAEGGGAESVSVTYSFIDGGRTDVTSDSAWLEKIVTDADGNHSFLWNEKYKEFPTSSENPGDYWAYLGTNIPAVSKSGVVNLSTYLSVNTCSTASWIAFKIKVPETATYAISELKAAKYKNASTNMSISVVELTDDLSEVLEEGNVATYGTAGIGSNGYGTRTGAKLYSELGIENEMLLGKTNIRLTDTNAAEYLKPTVATLTNKGSALMRKDKEYVIFCHTEDGRAPTIVSLTLGGEKVEPEITTSLDVKVMEIDQTATLSSVVKDELGEVVTDAEVTYTTDDTDIISISGNTVTALSSGTAIVTATATVNGKVLTTTVEVIVSVNLTPVYKFTKSAIVDGTSAVTSITDYSMINTEVSTGKWKFHGSAYVNANMALQSNGVQFNSYIEHAKAGLGTMVLKIKADASGLYNSVIEYVKQTYCGRIDMFVIPEALAGEQGWDMTQSSGITAAIAHCTDKDNAGYYMASIDMHTDSVESSPRNGNAVYLAKGDNFLLMRIRQGCGTSSHKDENYYGYVTSISFSPAEAGLALSLNEHTIRPSDRSAVIASGIDVNGNADEITSITYESLDPTVATVDAATGVITPVKDGVARIEATATIGAIENVKAQIPVTVQTEWNPDFRTNKNVISEESIQGANIDCSKVDNYDYIDRSSSSGIWKYGTRFNFGTPLLYGSDLQFGIKDKASLGKGNNAFILSAIVDATGVYNTSIGITPNPNGGIMDVYMVPKSYVEAKGFSISSLGNVNAIISDCENNKASEAKYIGRADANSNVNPSQTSFDGETVKFNSGEHYVIVVVSASEGATGNKDGRYWGLLTNITLDNTASVTVLADSTEIAKGEETTLQSVVRDEYYSVYSGADVKYESLNTAIATVDGNIVTAVAKGKAIIRATATVDGATVSDTVEIVVGDEAVAKTVTIATSINGKVDILPSWPLGSNATVTAPEIGGKTFRHWVLGTEESGIPVSDKAEYTFKAVSNTYLTAVYSENAPADAKVVEFYVDNGGYIGNAIANEEGKVTLPTEKPSLTGFEFSKWMLDAKTVFTEDTIVEDLLTKVVATYNASKINNTEYYYGDKIVNTSENAKVWKRDDKIVAYGTEYTYYVWADSVITSEDGERPKAPIIVLDSNEKQDGARMIEYDANGFTIVEAGILFGDGKAMTVDSCKYKAKSNRNSAHGQFTAKPSEESYIHARGYLIYIEGDDYKVVYSH